MASSPAKMQCKLPRAASDAGASSSSADRIGGAAASAQVFQRVLADVEGPRAGPTVVFVGGMHGNEPAGALAGAQLAPLLEQLRSELAGRVVLLSGNRPALRVGLRFLQRDLNRGWTASQMGLLSRLSASELDDEDREQLELWQLVEQLE
ncbi:MAG: hypothetical protein RL033_7856, partial [Pseudomonadota bacterium]